MKGQSVLTALKMDNSDMLEWALEEENIHIDELLEIGNTPLQLAVSWRAAECVEFLLRKGAAPDCHFNGFSPLMIAAQEGCTNIAAILIDGNADINYHGQYGLTPLMAEARDGHQKTVRLLLDRGADAEDTSDAGNTALNMAEMAGQADTAQMIRNHLESRYVELSPAFLHRHIIAKDPGESD